MTRHSLVDFLSVSTRPMGDPDALAKALRDSVALSVLHAPDMRTRKT